MTSHLRLVTSRPRIRNKSGEIVGVVCTRCGHERFPFMKDCPRCEDTAFRDLDTSMNELKLRGWIGWMTLLTLAKILGGAA